MKNREEGRPFAVATVQVSCILSPKAKKKRELDDGSGKGRAFLQVPAWRSEASSRERRRPGRLQRDLQLAGELHVCTTVRCALIGSLALHYPTSPPHASKSCRVSCRRMIGACAATSSTLCKWLPASNTTDIGISTIFINGRWVISVPICYRLALK